MMTTWAWERLETDPGHVDEGGTYIFDSEEVHADEPVLPRLCSVALFGDSTVACQYLPPANRPENHLLVRLRREFPDRRFVVQNVAGEGESPAADLRSGRLERLFAAVPQMHLAFLRYNIRDTEPEGFQEHLDG